LPGHPRIAGYDYPVSNLSRRQRISDLKRFRGFQRDRCGCVAKRNPDSDVDSYFHADAGANCNPYSDSYRNQDAYSNQNAYSNQDTDADEDGDTYADGDQDSYTDEDGYTHTDRDQDCHPHADANRDAYCRSDAHR
jgi:hypothetical protein